MQFIKDDEGAYINAQSITGLYADGKRVKACIGEDKLVQIALCDYADHADQIADRIIMMLTSGVSIISASDLKTQALKGA